ncbi:RNA-binding protein [Rhodobaculum claviforme]|uniref:YlxR domain-containing protein n=1 Tax=Rhodobaculum claviforme TaxID=1549854 RepID=A0A934WID2_9RHOB|nr:RNA-binding protein [Rhodobaculum claviforme]MBK5926642.1 hypothetical protein [Rhodobaculum claviforme]
MTRGGRTKDRDGPERRCIVSGESQPATGLIRFVVGPEGSVVPDVDGRLPGRGIWVSAERDALERAVARKLFSRAARAQVTVPEGLVALIEVQLLRRVIDMISLARRGGTAVCGYEKVRTALEKGEAAVLVQACDGSERGRAKLRPPAGGDSLVTVLAAAELGLAFGRDRVIHAALAAGGLASRVVDEARRLAGVRGQDGAFGTGEDRQDA